LTGEGAALLFLVGLINLAVMQFMGGDGTRGYAVRRGWFPMPGNAVTR
jgi:hypothetical protein